MARVWIATRTLVVRAVREFFDDQCPQRAAAIAYYALLSLFPLVILAVGVLGRLVDSESARREVVDFVLRRVPLRAGAGRADLESLLSGVADHATGLGVLGIVGLVLSASAVMGALRQGLNAAWDVDDPRPPLQGKAIDLLLVFGFGVLALLSLGLSVAVRLTASLASTVGDWLGTGAPVTLAAWGARLVPVALSVAIFALLFRLVPARATRLRDTWPGVVVAAAGFELAKAGFGFYLERFADYDAVYASIGSVVAFMVFVWVAANVLLLGAEFASEWPRLRRRAARPG